MVLMLQRELGVYKLESIQARVDRMAMGLKNMRNNRGNGLFSWRRIFLKYRMTCFQINSGLLCRYESELHL